MAKSQIVTALDIGTSTIKALQIRSHSDGREPELLGVAKELSIGVRRGVVADSQEVAAVIKTVLGDLFRISQQKIGGVFVDVGGSHLFLTSSQGGVAVSRADQRISREDIDRVLTAAQALSLPANKEILDAWPKAFVVDQERGIKKPLGMKGIRLEVEIIAVCGFSPYIKNVIDAVLGAGYQIYGMVPSPLAAARSVLTPRQRELGCAVVDIGARTTDLSVFEEGELIHAAVFPMGSANITDDIAIGLKIDIDSAEKIKKEFGFPLKNLKTKQAAVVSSRRHKSGEKKKKGLAVRDGVGKRNNKLFEVEISSGSSVVFSPRMLAGIIEARLHDIFDEINRELKKVARQELLPAGVALTGGGAQMAHIIDVAKTELKLPCNLGLPSGVRGIEEDSSWSAACGLALGGIEADGDRRERDHSVSGFGSRIKDWLKMFVP